MSKRGTGKRAGDLNTRDTGAATSGGNTRGTFAYPGLRTRFPRWVIKKIPRASFVRRTVRWCSRYPRGEHRSPVEMYNDANSDVVAFFDAVKHHGDEMSVCGRQRRTVVSYSSHRLPSTLTGLTMLLSVLAGTCPFSM